MRLTAHEYRGYFISVSPVRASIHDGKGATGGTGCLLAEVDSLEAAKLWIDTRVPRVIVREFSAAGPCLTVGQLIRETPNFYVYLEWKGGDRFGNEERLISKKRPGHYSRAHIEPCTSCRDHAQTSYPNGLMD